MLLWLIGFGFALLSTRLAPYKPGQSLWAN